MRENRFERTENFFVELVRRPGSHYEPRAWVRMLLWFLRRCAGLFQLMVQLRLYLYETGILRPHALGCQVISVGNLTVGGTGKTPVVETLARELAAAGRKVAILSRGYKKAEPGFWRKLGRALTLADQREPPRVVSDGERLLLDSAMSGDEPYMLASNLRNVVVLVDKDRVKSGRYAIRAYGCDTLILDDGFQYLSLKHRVEIVLVDRTDPFANGFMLPRGLLREPARNIRRADAIFITKSDGHCEDLRRNLHEMNPRALLIECRHCPRHLQNVFGGERRELEWLKGRSVAALSGIAVPEGFERSLETLGAHVVLRKRFADHHRFSQQEVIDLINEARRAGAEVVLTTEKDAVRMPRLDRADVPCYFLRVDIEIIRGAANFQDCLGRILIE